MLSTERLDEIKFTLCHTVSNYTIMKIALDLLEEYKNLTKQTFKSSGPYCCDGVPYTTLEEAISYAKQIMRTSNKPQKITIYQEVAEVSSEVHTTIEVKIL